MTSHIPRWNGHHHSNAERKAMMDAFMKKYEPKVIEQYEEDGKVVKVYEGR